MKAEWMANVGGEEYGPFTWDQMLDMAAQGRVTPELPIRKVSDSQWSTAAAIPGLLGGAKPAAAKPATAKVAAPAAKKAKAAPPRPPSGRPAPPVLAPPQNIPAGIPVGSPVGLAVAPPPVSSSSSGGFSFDMGAAPSGKQRTVKKSVLDDDDVVAKKKSNTPLMLGVLGGGAALVAVIVGLTVYITMNRGGKDEKLVATKTSTAKEGTDEEGLEANPGEANPEGEADTGPKKATAAKPKAAKGNKTASPDAKAAPKSDQKAIVEGIRDWKNIVTLKSVGIGNARVAISRVWLAADATGKRAALPGAATQKPAEAAVPAAEDAKKEETPADSATAGGDKAKYVFVEVAISNKAGAAIKYKGWNNPGPSAAILADDQNQIFPLVPKSETPGVQRLGAADVPGGGGLTETLVFEAPTGSFDALHLVLPQVVFYPSMKGKQFALEITPDVLANEGGPPVAVPPAGLAGGEGNDPLVPGRKLPTDPGTPEGVTPSEPAKPEPATTVKTPEPPPPKKPSLIDEINKSFEGKEKMDEGKGAEGAKTEPVKKTEPAKKPLPGKNKPKGKK
ncbi:MAG: DUF4339 domain-containing protein [Pirellulaceae bacterium]